MEVGRVCAWGGLGKCYLPFLGLINVKNNGALVARQPHSTWFWFTARGEGTACSKLVPPDEPPPSLTSPRRLLSPRHPSPRPRGYRHVKILSEQKHNILDFASLKQWKRYIFNDLRIVVTVNFVLFISKGT